MCFLSIARPWFICSCCGIDFYCFSYTVCFVKIREWQWSCGVWNCCHIWRYFRKESNKMCITHNITIYSVNNTTIYIGKQYSKFGDMFRFFRSIIRLNTKHSTGTFSEGVHYGIPYCLQNILTWKIIELFHQPTIMHNFYSLTICLLHYYTRHVSSINMPIFRRKNCIHTASGIFASSWRWAC